MTRSDFLNQFHHVFFFGDLNYRLDFGSQKLERSPEIEQFDDMIDLITTRKFQHLYKFDQLLKEISENRVLQGFQEGILDFPPSYKVIIHSTVVPFLLVE